MSAGCFPGRRHMRGAGAETRGRRMKRKKKERGRVIHQSQKRLGKGRCWVRGHLFSVSGWIYFYHLSLFFFAAAAECLIGLLAAADGGDPQSPIRCFTTNETLNLPSSTCNRKSCPDAMCVKWITQRKTLHIRQKGEKKKRGEGEIFITVWMAFDKNHLTPPPFFLSAPLLMDL